MATIKTLDDFRSDCGGLTASELMGFRYWAWDLKTSRGSKVQGELRFTLQL